MKTTKHLKVLLIFALALTMLSSSLVFAAETSLENGTTDGTVAGTLDGNIAGKADFRSNKVNNYLSAMAGDALLVTRFSLNYDNLTYQNAFIAAYKTSFQTAYNLAYRAVNMDEYITPVEKAYEHGEAAGIVQGQLSAMIDFTQGKLDNWEKSYNAYLTESSIVRRYFLDRESLAYRSGFMSGHREGFMNSYIETYQLKNVEAEIRNKNAHIIAMTETFIEFQEEYVHFVLGAASPEMRTPMSLFIPAATLYEPTYISASKTQNTFNVGNAVSKMTPVSGKYKIDVLNDRGSVTLKKPITLSFEYQGSERAGVYQWLNGKWVYQYTTLTDGSIFITIPAGFYAGGEYAIFIDETYKTVSDITFNWAYKEIYTLMRRDIISDAQAYSPNAKITRAQLAQMIYNQIGVTNPLTTTAPVISDASALGNYKKAVEYMVGKRYMKLDAKGAFNPSGTITYAETEVVLSNMFLRNVSWSEVSSKMLTEKFARSAGATNKAANLTKAEAAYMMMVFYK